MPLDKRKQLEVQLGKKRENVGLSGKSKRIDLGQITLAVCGYAQSLAVFKKSDEAGSKAALSKRTFCDESSASALSSIIVTSRMCLLST